MRNHPQPHQYESQKLLGLISRNLTSDSSGMKASLIKFSNPKYQQIANKLSSIPVENTESEPQPSSQMIQTIFMNKYMERLKKERKRQERRRADSTFYILKKNQKQALLKKKSNNSSLELIFPDIFKPIQAHQYFKAFNPMERQDYNGFLSERNNKDRKNRSLSMLQKDNRANREEQEVYTNKVQQVIKDIKDRRNRMTKWGRKGLKNQQLEEKIEKIKAEKQKFCYFFKGEEQSEQESKKWQKMETITKMNRLLKGIEHRKIEPWGNDSTWRKQEEENQQFGFDLIAD